MSKTSILDGSDPLAGKLEKDADIVKADVSPVVNASGHVDKLERQYGLISICSAALNVDCAWVAFGGSIVVGFSNGGPPGIIWELLVACFYYFFIAASLAELASSIPSAGGVYHWASVSAGKYGRGVGFFAGILNFSGWIFGVCSLTVIPSNVLIQMYGLFHPDFVPEIWHIYLAFVAFSTLCCSLVIFANRWLPYIQFVGSAAVVCGGIISIIIVAAMPSQHASASSVFIEWDNQTGWPSGVAFITGMLNGAYTIGTPDSVTHLSEELPNPRRDLPKAIATQMVIGTIMSFCFAITIMFGINDIDAVLNSGTSFPLGIIYQQATNTAATFGLLFIILLALLGSIVGNFVVVGRCWWALARDDAIPFARFFSRASVSLSCPVHATVLCYILSIGFGAIQLGSTTAFTDLVGSFIVLTTSSHFLAIFPHLLSGRNNVPRGPFWMGRYGALVNTVAVLCIVFTNIMYCFPYFLPVTVKTMNYNSVILLGLLCLTTGWWVLQARGNYLGPHLPHLDEKGRRIDEDIL